jgi:hypothetical protein
MKMPTFIKLLLNKLRTLFNTMLQHWVATPSAQNTKHNQTSQISAQQCYSTSLPPNHDLQYSSELWNMEFCPLSIATTSKWDSMSISSCHGPVQTCISTPLTPHIVANNKFDIPLQFWLVDLFLTCATFHHTNILQLC